MSAGAPLPRTEAVAVFAAPQHWCAVDFISDLHLEASAPRTFDAWAAHLLHTDADAVFILGDLFDLWIGDDTRGRDFERRCVEVMAAASRSHQLGFMAGNRDFLVGSDMLAACGAVALDDPCVLTAWGRRVLLSHGDALCLDDVEYQRFRAEVRNPAWRSTFLARPLAERAALAAQIRAASQARKRGMPDPALWADVDALAAARWMATADTPDLVHGHTHRPGTEVIAPGRTRHVLSDWDLDGGAPRAQVLRLTCDGFARIAPQGAA